MEPCNVQMPIVTQKAEHERKSRFQIVKLEERIGPCSRIVCDIGGYDCFRRHFKGRCP